MMSVMMLYMRDAKERRIHEAEQKPAYLVATVKMVRDITKGHFKGERRKRTKNADIDKGGRGVGRGKRILG